MVDIVIQTDSPSSLEIASGHTMPYLDTQMYAAYFAYIWSLNYLVLVDR